MFLLDDTMSQSGYLQDKQELFNVGFTKTLTPISMAHSNNKEYL